MARTRTGTCMLSFDLACRRTLRRSSGWARSGRASSGSSPWASIRSCGRTTTTSPRCASCPSCLRPRSSLTPPAAASYSLHPAVLRSMDRAARPPACWSGLLWETSICGSMSTELSGTVCCAGGAQRVRLGDGARRLGGACRPPHQPPDRGYRLPTR